MRRGCVHRPWGERNRVRKQRGEAAKRREGCVQVCGDRSSRYTWSRILFWFFLRSPSPSSSSTNSPPRCLVEERYASSSRRPGKRARGCRPGSERSLRGGKLRAAFVEEPVLRRRLPLVPARSGLMGTCGEA